MFPEYPGMDMIVAMTASSSTGSSSTSTTKRTRSTVNSEREMLLPDGSRKNLLGRRKLTAFILVVVSVSSIALVVLCIAYISQHWCDITDRSSAEPNTVNVGFYEIPLIFIQSPQLYAFGGVQAHKEGDSTFQSSGARLNTCDMEWSNTSSMPYAASNMCGAVILDNIYLFGGITGDMKNKTQSNNAVVYDSFVDTYTTLRPMPESREACGAAVLGDHIYVAGGSKASHAEKPNDLAALSSVNRYNIKTDKWSTVQPMKAPRNSVRLVALDGLLYAIGGQRLKTFEVYDPDTDQWTLMPSSLNQFSNLGATVYKDKIYVLDQNRFEVYSPNTGKWEILPKPNYQQKYHFINLISFERGLCTMGLVTDKDEILNKIVCYDPDTEEWAEQHVTYPLSVNFPAIFVVKY